MICLSLLIHYQHFLQGILSRLQDIITNCFLTIYFGHACDKYLLDFVASFFGGWGLFLKKRGNVSGTSLILKSKPGE